MNQLAIIKNVNLYLQYKKRDVVLTSGYCHGLALLWLYQISVGREQWFYDVTEKIAACRQESDFNAIEHDIEKFISYIEWLQHSNQYQYDVNQLDLVDLTGLSKVFSISFLFHHTQLDSFFKYILHDFDSISISGLNHTVGIFRKGDQVFLFDANDATLKPKIITDFKLLKYEVVKALFNRDYLPNSRLPLEVTALSLHANINVDNVKAKANAYYAELVKNDDNLDRPGLARMTNLYLACESNESVLVQMLLDRGVNPNKTIASNLTPLHIASANGYTDIVSRLLKYGANTDVTDSDGNTPAELAKIHGHADALKLLTENNQSGFKLNS